MFVCMICLQFVCMICLQKKELRSSPEPLNIAPFLHRSAPNYLEKLPCMEEELTKMAIIKNTGMTLQRLTELKAMLYDKNRKPAMLYAILACGSFVYAQIFFMVGNNSTSRMDGLSVSSMTRRSTPIPRPPVGGRPYSSAQMKSVSITCASSSPASRCLS